MKRILAALTLFALTAGSASADVIAERKDLMKQRGPIMGDLSAFAKGEKAFDTAAVMAQLQALATNAETGDQIDVLWAPGTESGDTRSSPKIWEDRAGYKAAADKYLADVNAAIAAAPADAAALGAVLGPIGANCGSCHGDFRLSRN